MDTLSRPEELLTDVLSRLDEVTDEELLVDDALSRTEELLTEALSRLEEVTDEELLVEAFLTEALSRLEEERTEELLLIEELSPLPDETRSREAKVDDLLP